MFATVQSHVGRQLDGGHIPCDLFGRRYARAIGIGSVLVTLGLILLPVPAAVRLMNLDSPNQ